MFTLTRRPGDEFFAGVARDIIRWMDEWLSDRAHGGFYASQDADYSMDDDGDYFTWTLSGSDAVLTEDEAAVATLYYDIQEAGDMHHNPAKNVLYVANPTGEIARRLNIPEEQAQALLDSAQKKMYAARLAASYSVCGQDDLCGVERDVRFGLSGGGQGVWIWRRARHFALRSLDRLLSEGWNVVKINGRGPSTLAQGRSAPHYSTSLLIRIRRRSGAKFPACWRIMRSR